MDENLWMSAIKYNIGHARKRAIALFQSDLSVAVLRDFRRLLTFARRLFLRAFHRFAARRRGLGKARRQSRPVVERVARYTDWILIFGDVSFVLHHFDICAYQRLRNETPQINSFQPIRCISCISTHHCLCHVVLSSLDVRNIRLNS